MALASRGLRDMDDGPEKIEDAAELAQVRQQAMTVQIKGVLAGLVLTAGWMVAPLVVG